MEHLIQEYIMKKKIKTIKKLKEIRISKIMNNETPLPFYKNGKVVFHLIPNTSIDFGQYYNLEKVNSSKLIPFVANHWNTTYNVDGILTYGKNSNKEEAYTYVQFFRNGIIEVVDGYLLQAKQEKFIPISSIEEEIINKSPKYVDVLKELGIESPIYSFLTILDVKGYVVPPDRMPWVKSHLIEREILTLPEVKIDVHSFEPSKVFRYCFDSIWNACGILKSPNYNEKGEWYIR